MTLSLVSRQTSIHSTSNFKVSLASFIWWLYQYIRIWKSIRNPYLPVYSLFSRSFHHNNSNFTVWFSKLNLASLKRNFTDVICVINSEMIWYFRKYNLYFHKRRIYRDMMNKVKKLNIMKNSRIPIFSRKIFPISTFFLGSGP